MNINDIKGGECRRTFAVADVGPLGPVHSIHLESLACVVASKKFNVLGFHRGDFSVAKFVSIPRP
jgi:hypothetical protein